MGQAGRGSVQNASSAFVEHGATVLSELQQYSTQYQYEINVDTANPDSVKKALDEEINRLRDSELHVYERQAADAYKTYVRTFRSRIAPSLRRSFDAMHGHLRAWNRRLSQLPALSKNDKYELNKEENQFRQP